jgi:pyruvate/2-oxoglutarate dehydrogenase complex dihydrolipoamide dehydrogenase (E3) component
VEHYDLVIIGGGAAGSEAAFAVGGGKHRVLIAESDHFGGTCTNHGCVPTKALVRAARTAHAARRAGEYGIRVGSVEVDWAAVIGRAYQVRDYMLRYGTKPFEDEGIAVRFPCRATFTGERRLDVGGEEVEAGAVLIATGLEPAVPPVPGLAESGYLDNESVLELGELPRRLGVIGSGPIGAEFAQVFRRFGVEVTVFEVADRLIPVEEPEAGAAVEEAFRAEGIRCVVGARVESVSRAGSIRRVVAGGETYEVDELLVAAGRSFDGGRLGLDAAGIKWSAHGVGVDSHLRTSQPWAWAAGDVVGGPLFTHVASAMGEVAGRNALSGDGQLEELDLRVVPRVTFTDPEVASVGMTEKQAREAGREVRVGIAWMRDAEKAEIDGLTIGHVKVVADARSGELLGCSIVGETAGDMIHEAVALMAGRVPVGVAARAMHAYPTFSELTRSALGEAAGG